MSSPSPSKSRLGRMGGALQRTSTLLSPKRSGKPSTASSAQDDADSTSLKSVASAAPVVPVAESPKPDITATPSKSKLARFGGILQRTPSLLSPVRRPSTPSSERDADSRSVKGAAAVPAALTSPSQSSLALEPAATPSKSKLSRIGGALRRTSSRLSLKRPKTPSISSERDADSISLKDDAPVAPAAQTPPAEPSLIAEHPATDTVISSDATTAADSSPLTPLQVAVFPEPEPSLHHTLLSPVQEATSPLIDSPVAGPVGFVDEPVEVPQHQVTGDSSQTESIEEYELVPRSDEQPDIPSAVTAEPAPEPSALENITIEPVTEPSALESITTEPLQESSTPEPLTTFSEPANSPSEQDSDLAIAQPTKELKDEVDQDARDASIAQAPVQEELVLPVSDTREMQEEIEPAPTAIALDHEEPQPAPDMPTPQVTAPPPEPSIPPPAAVPAFLTPRCDSNSKQDTSTQYGVPAASPPRAPPRSETTRTLGSMIAEGIVILLRLFWEFRGRR